MPKLDEKIIQESNSLYLIKLKKKLVVHYYMLHEYINLEILVDSLIALFITNT